MTSLMTGAVLLAGATGLVGNACLQRLIAAPGVRRIVAVTRRPVVSNETRVESKLLAGGFSALDGAEPIAARVALCALGTTRKRAGSDEAFRAVDLEAVLSFARWAQRGGAEVFGLVSSVGADAHARGLYLRTKGEVEDAVAGLGFPCFVVLRPGLLLGARRERRPGEELARVVVPWLHPLLAGRLRRFRAIPAGAVASALASVASSPPGPGRHVWHNDEIARAVV